MQKEKLDKLDFKNYALKNGEDGKFYMTWILPQFKNISGCSINVSNIQMAPFHKLTMRGRSQRGENALPIQLNRQINNWLSMSKEQTFIIWDVF